MRFLSEVVVYLWASMIIFNLCIQNVVTGNTTLTDQRKIEIQRIIDNHDSQFPPDFGKDTPTIVTVQLYIVTFDSISEATMDYSLNIFLRQTWTDPRLKYTQMEGMDMLELSPKIMDNVWVPDLYFVNEKKAALHEVTVPNKLMHVFPSGEVLYSSRLSMTLSCDMNLMKFPFDHQTCHVTAESYSYSTKNIIFKWHSKPVMMRDHLRLPQFEFKDITSVNCTKTYVGTGTYTCIRADFHLERSYGYYVSQVYVPSILIVILSWVSFWLDVEAVPSRITLGLLTVLTMTTQSANARAHLPRVSYIKAIDVWMAMCLFFVFAALIEFAYVNVTSRVEKRLNMGGLKLEGMGKIPSSNVDTQEDDDHLGCPFPSIWCCEFFKGTDDSDNVDSSYGHAHSRPKGLFHKAIIGRAKARRLDKKSRLAFPLVFVVFNCFYWIFYMTWEPDIGTTRS